MTQLFIASSRILLQLEQVIIDISPRDFTCASRTLGGSSIGQHIRHTIEFFVCLEKGFTSGVINYDNRAHDRIIETDKVKAVETLRSIQSFIASVNHNKALILEAIYSADEKETYTVDTNYCRELAYNIEHAIHHMAIMKIGLKEVAPYVEIPHDFGVAVSTVRHHAAAGYQSEG